MGTPSCRSRLICDRRITLFCTAMPKRAMNPIAADALKCYGVCLSTATPPALQSGKKARSTRQTLARQNTDNEEQQGSTDNQQALLEAKRNDFVNHCLPSLACCSVFCSARSIKVPFTTSRSPGFRPERMTARSLRRRPTLTGRN
jgi:hypothetical protein